MRPRLSLPGLFALAALAALPAVVAAQEKRALSFVDILEMPTLTDPQM